MSFLKLYRDDAAAAPLRETGDPREMAELLRPINVRFERWESPVVPPRDAPADEILAVYRPYLDGLMGETGAGSADVIRINAATPNKAALREKFLSEHTHSEDEVRFFVHGSGHFVLHVDGHVYDVECTEGDLISVPEGVSHWFDAGPDPDVVALRVFTDTTGWVANYTGDPIASRFPVT
ncbi:dioxygenase [Ameyamaea chiangmaiensis NBRC 103196]|uniref:Acireductone dioxygenase n=1 Tax=Ameyamaea chiangmaiensis TaxID=442969 RepID=A0A850PHV9_9PROT|nr:cupin domain-containing protein [Ameyamaea chiangmaiensis]MBS4076442.1 acireductone dioxygenase [Ameyamaea chiangmaiensis]NVN41412.1 acireductone dioxygenase [Ameyamaea chiangmaiensis]GBQ61903.1 dioxygenase [Ameyamaea chiangmaiensis NBRC 103196]